MPFYFEKICSIFPPLFFNVTYLKHLITFKLNIEIQIFHFVGVIFCLNINILSSKIFCFKKHNLREKRLNKKSKNLNYDILRIPPPLLLVCLSKK